MAFAFISSDMFLGGLLTLEGLGLSAGSLALPFLAPHGVLGKPHFQGCICGCRGDLEMSVNPGRK